MVPNGALFRSIFSTLLWILIICPCTVVCCWTLLKANLLRYASPMLVLSREPVRSDY
jgi:hypothetical protein